MVAAELKSAKGYVTREQCAWLDALHEVPGVRTVVWRPVDWTAGEVEHVLRGEDEGQRGWE